MLPLLTVVEPINRILGVDEQTFWSAVIQLFNVLILILILYWLLYKPVLSLLDKRQRNIRESIQNAQNLFNEADELKAKYEAILQNADDEKTQILNGAKKLANEMEFSIIAAAKEEAIKIKETAFHEIELQKSKVTHDMKEQILDISALIAGKYVEAVIDTGMQERLLNEAIDDLGDATWLN